LKKARRSCATPTARRSWPLAEENEDIVALDADLVSSSGMKPFFEKYPNRAINVGVAEANMIGIAAGLSLSGRSRSSTASARLPRARRAT
jgi:transketolase C-terminal domain/subunit